MKKINVERIIESKGLDPEKVAKMLFPNNGHPRMALRRILNDKAVLDADQMGKLALMAGITIEELFGTVWQRTSSKGGARILTFETGTFIAELDRATWITKIFDKGTLFYEEIIHDGAVGVSFYLKELDRVITNHKKQLK